MVATVPSMIRNFNMNNIMMLKNKGYDVDVACNFDDTTVWDSSKSDKFKEKLKQFNINFYQVDFCRNPSNIVKVFCSYKQLLELSRKRKYKLIHCHTPVAGVVARLVAHKLKIKCLYTAHGFHFFKGAPWKNWIVFYPIEKFLSKYTDVIITINNEDYNRASKDFKDCSVEYVPGIGVDIDKFSSISEDSRRKLRDSLGVADDDIMLLSVGELSRRKNHEVVIDAMNLIGNNRLKYFICGRGSLESQLKEKINKLGLQNNVFLLGYRNDIAELNSAADIFVFPSLQEGLPVALMEAIASKRLVVCSNIRGNMDLVTDEHYLFKPTDIDDVTEKIKNSVDNMRNEDVIGRNFERLDDCFSLNVVSRKMSDIYDRLLR